MSEKPCRLELAGPAARTGGFTVFELIIVMLIVAILAAIAVPSFKYVTVSNRISTELNSLVGDLQYARAEAVKEGYPVTVCASTTGTSCAASNSWHTGWIVFLDMNGNKAVNSAHDQILRTRPAFSASNSTDTLIATSAALRAITYNREGYAATGSTSVENLQLHSAPQVNNWTRCLQVTPVGALTVELYGVGTPSCQ